MNVKFNFKKLATDVLAKRVKDDVSFKKVADKHKMTVSLLHSVEAQRAVPSCENLAKILTWLGTEPNDYFIIKIKPNA